MSHMFDRTYGETKGELEGQLRMNLAFIRGLRTISGKSIKEVGRETEEGVIPEFIHPEKLEKERRRLRLRV